MSANRGMLQNAIDSGWLRDSGSMYQGGPHMQRVLSTALRIAQGMEYVHSQVLLQGLWLVWHASRVSHGAQGVVHCDLCPRNVLLSSLTGDDVEVKVRF